MTALRQGMVRTAVGDGRNGLPFQRPYRYQGTKSEAEEETAARLARQRIAVKAAQASLARRRQDDYRTRNARYWELRGQGRSVAEAAAGTGISVRTAWAYERKRREATAGEAR